MVVRRVIDNTKPNNTLIALRDVIKRINCSNVDSWVLKDIEIWQTAKRLDEVGV